ncbi:hypothetical protein MNV49_005146 [Pseudohyphozyma bogoriensis]|nr:hypothetical protein MNV49_005146 [Pseudohyphozyma bogoriensis]
MSLPALRPASRVLRLRGGASPSGARFLSLPATMRAVEIAAQGGTDVMEVKEIPIKKPTGLDVLVKVDWSGVNFLDTYQRDGTYKAELPFTLGNEASGVVAALGEASASSGLKVGDRVAGFTKSGSYAEYALASSNHVVKLPDWLSSKDAATVLLQGLTAVTLVKETHEVKPAQIVIVQAAAGGLGLLLVQLASHLGAKVVGLTSTPEKAALVKKAGATKALLYSDDILAEVGELSGGEGVDRGADVIYDGVGQATFRQSLELLKRFVCAVFSYVHTREEFVYWSNELFKLVEEAVSMAEPSKRENIEEADRAVLEQLGYKNEFKRDFSVLSSFNVAFSVIGLLPSISTVLGYSFGYVGFVGATWGWIAASLLIQTLGLSMAEIASSLPTAGGLYYASYKLAPNGWGPLAAWVTGWSNMVGQATTGPSIDWALASMITSVATLYHESYVAQNWHTYLIYLAILLTHGTIACFSSKRLAQVASLGSFLNAALVFIFIIVIPAATKSRPRFNSNATVWKSNGTNSTEWPEGFAFLQTFLAVIYTLAGYDAPFHLSEETSNANIAAPRAIAATVQLGGILGFAVLLVIAYTIPDPDSALASPVGQPMITYLNQASVLCCDDVGDFAYTVILCFTASSRVAFAYSRDGALPLSRYWRHVNTVTNTPVNAVWLIAFLGSLFGLLSFGGSVAISALFSICAIAQYSAFVTPVAIKLFFGGNGRFQPGPWNLGRFSKPINAVAVAFVSVIIPVLCFPAVKGADLNAQSMNYSALLYGGTMLLSSIWWIVDARKWFVGPRASPKHLPANEEKLAPSPSSLKSVE